MAGCSQTGYSDSLSTVTTASLVYASTEFYYSDTSVSSACDGVDGGASRGHGIPVLGGPCCFQLGPPRAWVSFFSAFHPPCQARAQKDAKAWACSLPLFLCSPPPSRPRDGTAVGMLHALSCTAGKMWRQDDVQQTSLEPHSRVNSFSTWCQIAPPLQAKGPQGWQSQAWCQGHECPHSEKGPRLPCPPP